LFAPVLLLPSASADSISVRHVEGEAHGFLIIHDADGKPIATGDLIQRARAGRITAHVVFRFRDGSIDEETTTFTERRTFRLLSDHHIQSGPTYPHPMDVRVDATTGMVTVHSVDKDGQQKVTTEHVDLPPDLANGMALILVKNLDPSIPVTKIPTIVATPKPRLIKLAITSDGLDECYIGGVRRKVTHYTGKIELGGVAGVVAPILGKQPEDMQIWVLGGEVPAVLRVQGQFYESGPVWTIELTSPTWPRTTHR
jgi:hypothetical protein